MRPPTARRVAVVAAAAVSALVASGLPAAAAPPATDGLTLIRSRTSLLGTHQWFQQTYRGLPVVNGWYAKHLDQDGHLSSVTDARKQVPANVAVSATVPAGQAAQTAQDAATQYARAADKTGGRKTAKQTAVSTRLGVVGGPGSRLVWQVTSRGTGGSIQTLVDATTKQTLKVAPLSDNYDGIGQVFDPNPVVALENQSLTDQDNADYPAIHKAYKFKLLPDLTDKTHLVGKWAKIVNKDAVSSRSHLFVYTRDKAGFEQVSAYYAITTAQRYIRSLGLTDVNAEPQKIETDTIPDDNSFYDPSVDQITTGTGGVDDAEDVEVVQHEYGHAVQDDQVPGFGESEEAGAIGEGFGDYLAVTLSLPQGKGYDPACVMDWDSTSYTDAPHCLRRVDTKKTVDDKTGEVHDDGEIWSAALWDINRALGRTKADKLIIQSQFYYAPDTSFAAAANNVVATARALYGKQTADKIRPFFVKRKILK
ncbi:M36 family metallopeptidase [Fodinicola acaciae]|uniref:M36 family metallopeptidase n=1 Tax=Fodinicola acaciae TaxID=2681555 RepID=UPI0013CF6278|nr:M36 family metallopeptidase [Fodinicola acaciae]